MRCRCSRTGWPRAPALGIAPDARCLALLPGSRGAEVEILSADFLQTAQLLRTRYPDLEVVVPLVNAKRREQFERIKAQVAPDLPAHLLDGKAREAMIASDAALLASGTAALECMLAKCPMVVGYRMKPFTFWLAQRAGENAVRFAAESAGGA
ncbi:Lipid-A-disaccharide synthase [Serratia rubidaea]|uniref:Lipid-A-disaccharide synthase n=1 Tax=Serratia rubidaea TaxID=61652 RepID=A0A4U9HUL0_SERRU|nr:Lipid-A-disaccharide synthase [Serratia rubidaea]